ncbi:MAG: CehA/McbA family metallohydrolase [Deltaproteobacteria bacterium]|nr:CehA/McbA family metallohydrolase [Deltaproteobacteria bacterium]
MHARTIWFFLSLAFLSGCPSEPAEEPPTPRPLGVDPSVPAGPGEVRAGILPEDAASFGQATWGGIAAEARPGDFAIYNDRARFVVRSQAGHGYVGIAGALIDADIVRPAGQLGRDTLEEAFLAFGIGRLASADTIELIADGTDGGPATVRVTGRDVPWTFVQGVAESDVPLQADLFLSVVTDYVLEPDSYELLIRTTLTNNGTEDARVNPLDGLIASQEDLQTYGSGEGLNPGDIEEPAAMGITGRQGEATLMLYRADGPLARFAAGDLLSSSGVELLAHGWRDIPPGESAVLERVRAVGPDPATLEAGRMAAQGITSHEITGVVRDDTGTAVEGARVHLVEPTGDGPRFQGFAITGVDGSYSLRAPAATYWILPTGAAVDQQVDVPEGSGRYAPFAHDTVNARQLAALRGESTPTPLPFAQGYGDATPIQVTVGEGGLAQDLTLPARASLTVTVVDGDGSPLPAYLSISTVDGPPTSPIDDAWRAGLGLPARTGNVMQAWTMDGTIELPLPPGTYEIDAWGSPRHERRGSSGTASAEGGAVTIPLFEILPRDGWLSMDSHLHGAPSNDGSLPMEDRLIVCAAAGVDLPVTTDHDRMASYQPLVGALGLGERMRVIDGVEVSPVLRGHFNLFPVEPQGPSVRNGGAPAWWEPYDTTGQLFGLIRGSELEGGSLLQVNHGRESSGMMSAAAYQPETGEPFRPDSWSWGFDVVEIVNSRSRYNWEETRADWFSWLSVGQRKVPMGVSDAHGRTAWCGYGRTDVFLDTTDPSSVTPEALAEAIRAGHVIVGGGITLRASATGGELPGDVVTGATLDLALSVKGPVWSQPETVRVIRNGEVVFEEDGLGPDGQPIIEWSGTFSDSPAEDAWYVVESEGVVSMGGPYGNAIAYALTNAFFLDLAGDGWDPPGVGD